MIGRAYQSARALLLALLLALQAMERACADTTLLPIASTAGLDHSQQQPRALLCTLSGNGRRSAAAAGTRHALHSQQQPPRSALSALNGHALQPERSAAVLCIRSAERPRSASAAAAAVLCSMISDATDYDHDHGTITLRNRIAQGHDETTVSLYCEMLPCLKAHYGIMRLQAYNDSVMMQKAPMRLRAYSDMGICRYAPWSILRYCYMMICAYEHITAAL